MKMTMESTNQIVKVNGIWVRIWEGKTESGIPCFALIAKVGVHADENTDQFERELRECKPAAITRRWGGTNFIFDGEN